VSKLRLRSTGAFFALVGVIVLPLAVKADNSTAFRVGPGVQMTCSATAPNKISTRGMLWCKSTDGDKLYYTDPSDVSTAVGSGGGGLTSTLVRTQLISPTTHVASLGIDLVYLVPAWIPSDVTQVRVWISNCDMLSGAHPSTAITGVDLAIGTSDGSFDFSGSATDYSNVTIPGNCIPYRSPLTSVTRGADGQILIAYNVPSGSDVFTENNIAGTQRCDSTLQVDPIPGGCASQADGTLAIGLEYNTASTRVVVLGDSIIRGYCSGTPVGFSGTAWYQLGPDSGYAVSTWGAVQQTLAGFSEWTKPWMFDGAVIAGAHVFVEAGLNDLPLDTSFKDYQAHIGKMVSTLRAMGAASVYLQTKTPNAAYGANEADRLIENSWLRLSPWGVDGIIDADLALDPTATGSLSATACGGGTCDCGDGTHLSAAANTAIQTLLEAVLP
jgi:lysophospholipase L1-like esterase